MNWYKFLSNYFVEINDESVKWHSKETVNLHKKIKRAFLFNHVWWLLLITYATYLFYHLTSISVRDCLELEGSWANVSTCSLVGTYGSDASHDLFKINFKLKSCSIVFLLQLISCTISPSPYIFLSHYSAESLSLWLLLPYVDI